jgi:hypothetical protein
MQYLHKNFKTKMESPSIKVTKIHSYGMRHEKPKLGNGRQGRRPSETDRYESKKELRECSSVKSNYEETSLLRKRCANTFLTKQTGKYGMKEPRKHNETGSKSYLRMGN